MKLYGYWRSSAAYRCRIAFNLKGLTPEHVPVHLRRGDQRAEEFLRLNPQGRARARARSDRAAGAAARGASPRAIR